MALQFYCYHRLYQTASSMLFSDVVKEDGVYALAANAQRLGTECRLKKVIPMAGRTELFREMGDFRRAGKIEGLSIDPTNDDLVVLNNRRNQILLGMPIGPFTEEGYTGEVHELHVYEKIK